MWYENHYASLSMGLDVPLSMNRNEKTDVRVMSDLWPKQKTKPENLGVCVPAA